MAGLQRGRTTLLDSRKGSQHAPAPRCAAHAGVIIENMQAASEDAELPITKAHIRAFTQVRRAHAPAPARARIARQLQAHPTNARAPAPVCTCRARTRDCAHR